MNITRKEVLEIAINHCEFRGEGDYTPKHFPTGEAVMAFVAECIALDRLIEQATPAPQAQLAEVAATVYVECRECDVCDHRGINDASDTLAACHGCDWSGPSPVEDKCPGCGEENCMAAACPECGGRYALRADANVPLTPPAAQAEQAVRSIEQDFPGAFGTDPLP
jgi:hypothetical protein